MTFIIGVTTDPDIHKRHWQERYPNLHEWKILGRYSSRIEAEKRGHNIAKRYGCRVLPSSLGHELDNWVIYRFAYQS